MNYSVFKLTEQDNNYYFYFLSPFDGTDLELVAESIEHYISNEPSQMNQYLMTVPDFDNVKVEKVDIPAITVLNKTFQPDDKSMLISKSLVSLIPPPKEKKKREAKPKADKTVKEPKAPKSRGKKSIQSVNISTEPAVVNLN